MEFFWSDTHLKHEGIIHICNRPFKSTEEMKKILINNHNSVVTKNDITYWLGDVYWGRQPDELGSIIRRMYGRHVLILGNHDDMNPFAYIRAGFESVHTSLKVHEFYLIHDPAPTIIYPNDPWLVGHLHSKPDEKRHSNWLDVGVDSNNFMPYSLDEVRSYFHDGYKVNS